MNKRKEHYSKKGSYAGYDKNHKERAALDYYSTPTAEVVNILETLNLPFANGDVILEPCAGGGHMVKGILDYIKSQKKEVQIKATDIQNRGNILNEEITIHSGSDYDFFSDDYPIKEADWIIMNPPYSVIEPFTMRALSIASKGVVALCRLQFLEGEGRFNNIFQNYPPNEVYIYVDRIACYKNGNIIEKAPSAQAYAWFVWDFEKEGSETIVHWLRRANKKEKK